MPIAGWIARDTIAAHESGEINLAHVKVITSTISRLPEHARAAAEPILLRAAHHVNPRELASLAAELEAHVDPDRALAAGQQRYASRYLTAAPTFGGMVHVEGQLDPVAGEMLLTALSSLSAPTGQQDDRTAGQRRADALAELTRRALAAGSLPDTAGLRPQLQVVVNWDDLRAAVGTAVLPHTGPVDAATMRRLACDASILPIVLGGDGQVLDIGRTAKAWPTAIRRAALFRDNNRCTFPGCEAPASHTELHHIVHWADGGPTCLENSTVLCGRHHTVLHQGRWKLRRDRDGQLVFTDPDGNERLDNPRPRLTEFLASEPRGCGESRDPRHGPSINRSKQPASPSNAACQPSRSIVTSRLPPRLLPRLSRRLGDHTARGAPAPSGSRNVSRVPAPGRLFTSREPPARRARSRSSPSPT